MIKEKKYLKDFLMNIEKAVKDNKKIIKSLKKILDK